MMIEGIESDRFICYCIESARDYLRFFENESNKEFLFRAKMYLDYVIANAKDKTVFSRAVSPADYEEAKNFSGKIIAIAENLGENLDKRLDGFDE